MILRFQAHCNKLPFGKLKSAKCFPASHYVEWTSFGGITRVYTYYAWPHGGKRVEECNHVENYSAQTCYIFPIHNHDIGPEMDWHKCQVVGLLIAQNNMKIWNVIAVCVLWMVFIHLLVIYPIAWLTGRSLWYSSDGLQRGTCSAEIMENIRVTDRVLNNFDCQ